MYRYTWCVHMAEAGNRTACDAGCRGRDAVPCVHPHVRRATGATGALREERPSMKTTARHASGTTTRRMTHERARSSSMRGPGLAQLSRRRTPRTQEEALVSSNRTTQRAVPERRVMATTRASSVCTSVHMVRTHGRGWQPNGVRRLLPRTRRRTLRDASPVRSFASTRPRTTRSTAFNAVCFNTPSQCAGENIARQSIFRSARVR